ncbi:hypothetical protein FHETE_4324 [Fusarium heterosporum]|uniref:Heterokaryon incompatibility domain-containing protein n=1 Tax=Fusarium heterosporum TaxID=42747 RepID=A0A8H5WST4_FUSHE|nr:hypothetical protein FHETE_4324 [Fusarium heterosporum]
MTRWHAASCKVPQVCVGQDSVPYCKTCGATAHDSLACLKQRASSSSPLPAIPPDEPMGKLNLSWPPSVPWTDELEVHETPMHEPARLRQDATESHATTAGSTSPNTSGEQPSPSANAIYPSLNHGQFRLITMEYHRDIPSAVVHLELDSYDLERHPDYETVSYSWGGEDGNSSLLTVRNKNRCQPVYVGEFWDILLQTQNCFSMLQYLKPPRGCRTIWVDAICINQADMSERNEQVQVMGQIYSQCSQVLLWLGADIVSPIPGTYPSRRSLGHVALDEEIDDVQESTTLRSLLQRRYFSRVWVVQELILAPRVIMPVGNTIVIANPRSDGFSLPSSLEFSWERTKTPWIKHITQGKVEALGLCEVISLLSKSQASDTRDKVFSILGLVPSCRSPTALRPDYSLSQKHVFLGAIGYSMFVEGKFFLLHKACGIANSTNIPSWAHSYHPTDDIWTYVLDRSDMLSLKCKDVSDRVRSMAHEECFEWSRQHVVTSFQTVSIGYEKQLTRNHADISSLDLHPRLHRGTGQLSINLKRLFKIRGTPLPLQTKSLQGCQIPLKMRPFTGPSFVYLIGIKALQSIVRVGDEVWMLEIPDDQPVFLVLRRNGEHQTFVLVATCHYVFCVSPYTTSRRLRGFCHIAERHITAIQVQDHLLSDYIYIYEKLNHESMTNKTTFRHLLRFAMRVVEEDDCEKWSCRWKNLYVSYVLYIQGYLESPEIGAHCHTFINADGDRLEERFALNRRITEIEQHYDILMRVPDICTCLEIGLSISRRTYGDYGFGNIDKLMSKTWVADKGIKELQSWLQNERGSGYVLERYFEYETAFYRDFELDGSQHRVTIV